MTQFYKKSLKILLKSILLIYFLFFLNVAFAISLKINIIGLNKNLEEKVKADLAIYNLLNEKEINSERIELLHDLAQDEINEILNANGYYQAKIKSNLIVKNQNYIVTYKINPGKPILIKNIELIIIDAKYPNHFNDLLAKQQEKIKINSILNHETYEVLKEELLAKFINLGYLNAHFEKHELLIDKENFSAYIKLHLKLDKIFYFGKITFECKKYPDEILERYVQLKKNTPYTTENLEKIRNNFIESNIFNKVKIKPMPNLKDKNDNIVPTIIKLSEKPKKRYAGNIGYGTNSGIRANISFLKRHIGKKGNQAFIKAGVSKISKGVNLNYKIPGSNPLKNNYLLFIGANDERIKNRLSKNLEFGGKKVYKKDENINKIFGLKYIREIYRISKNMPKMKSSYLLPSFQYDLKKIESHDNGFFAGKKANIFVSAGAKNIFSSTNFVQTEINCKWIKKITDNSRFLFRGTIGGIFAKNFEKIPISMRFFTGGDNSIRGFSYKSIGPREKDLNGAEVVVGGKYKAIASFEIERKIKNKLSAALFLDTGNAMNKWSERFASGAGGGIRYNSQFGSLRLDLAKPITRKIKKNLRIHLTFDKDL